MNKLKHIAIILSTFFLVEISHSSAVKTFCLDQDGFIYPNFNKCDGNDKELSIQEFRYLSEISNRSERESKLANYRASKIKTKENTELENSDLTLASKEVKDRAKFKIKENKKAEKSFSINQIKKKKEQEKKKAERLAKFEQRKKEQEKKKAERLAKFEQRKKEQEKKKAERLAKFEQRKQLQELKRVERLEKIQDNKNRISKKVSNPNKKFEAREVNQNLKTIYLSRNIIKGNLLPEVTSFKPEDFEVLGDYSNTQLKEIIQTHSNLYFIIPTNFENFSNTVSENRLKSRIVSGVQQVPNPEYRRLEMEIRNAEQKAVMAKREAEYYEAKLNNPYRQSSGVGWLDLLAVGTETAAAIAHQEAYYDLRNKLDSLVSQYSTTPMYIDKEYYSPYEYSLINIQSKKITHYDVFKYTENNFYTSKLKIEEQKSFKIPSGLNPSDKNFSNIKSKYNTKNEMNNWANAKLNNLEFPNLLAKLNNLPFDSEISSRNFYKSINPNFKEKKSFWGGLFSSDNIKKKNNNKFASLKTKQGYSVDNRFKSVVIVKTENGLGSGFYIKPDEVITNYHVIENSKNIILEDQNGSRSSAIVIKKDLKRDLALLKTNNKGSPVKIFNGVIKQGSKVDALGHPRGRKFSIAQGIVSAIRKEGSVYNATGENNVLYVQTDAAINKGNSGGPLFLKNEVIGVNTQGLSKGATEGMNFAVHFSELKTFLSN